MKKYLVPVFKSEVVIAETAISSVCDCYICGDGATERTGNPSNADAGLPEGAQMIWTGCSGFDDSTTIDCSCQQ